MTIRETITNTLRALVEIPAVVEMAREANEMRRTHIETALRLQLAKKQAHIERLQYRCSKAGADVAKALRDVAKWRDKAESSMCGAEELTLRMSRTEQFLTERTGMLTDARERSDRLSNDIGPARALIAEQNRQLESRSARIRELETHLTEVEEVRDSLADVINGEKKTTIADLWQPIGGSEWLAVCSSSDRILFGGGIRWPSICRPIERGDDRTHYILLEPPR